MPYIVSTVLSRFLTSGPFFYKALRSVRHSFFLSGFAGVFFFHTVDFIP